MNPKILEVNENIQSYKDEIVSHPLYNNLNGVVWEEESDVDVDPASYYEMYLDAMKQFRANTILVEDFVSRVDGKNIPVVGGGVDVFLKTTFSIIENGRNYC